MNEKSHQSACLLDDFQPMFYRHELFIVWINISLSSQGSEVQCLVHGKDFGFMRSLSSSVTDLRSTLSQIFSIVYSAVQ